MIFVYIKNLRGIIALWGLGIIIGFKTHFSIIRNVVFNRYIVRNYSERTFAKKSGSSIGAYSYLEKLQHIHNATAFYVHAHCAIMFCRNVQSKILNIIRIKGSIYLHCIFVAVKSVVIFYLYNHIGNRQLWAVLQSQHNRYLWRSACGFLSVHKTNAYFLWHFFEHNE